MDYSKTVNLLQTNFPMKADLPVREPEMLKHWEKTHLYERIQDKHKKGKTFLLHDGPPYANGDIHMGHALNKVLKDFVVKYKTLAGFRSPYLPGWDCHGLPIEHALFKELGKSKNQVSRIELRAKATDYAMRWVSKQKEDFVRLGVLGEWEKPYLTLSNDYEAGIVETFFQLRDKGFIYRGLKPGYWCAYDETALAEAEVEYAEKKSDSVYVRFKVVIPAKAGIQAVNPLQKIVENLDPRFRGDDGSLYILIWTTTPWTLPANTGLAFHPDEIYTVLGKDSSKYIVAEKLSLKIQQIVPGFFEIPSMKFKGKEMLGATAINPLHSRESRVVNATHVTVEDGTGIVHIAPGHGVEDFNVGQKYNLPVLSPVDERGAFTKEVGGDELVGKHVLKDANKAVMELLGDNLLYRDGKYTHSYPHCWRCKNPIIFRATEQWFLKVDNDFRQKLLDQIALVDWEPAHGVHRIQGMVETRPDWCLSRQRHWGAPIAVFSCKKCGTVLNNSAVNEKTIQLIREKGSTAYYEKSEQELLSVNGYVPPCTKCKSTDYQKEMDILDVWFDSGVSWHAVIEKYFSKPKPEAVMYLEGSDQHRGWFQTSLIPSVALREKAPYDVVLTHGFVVDGKGHKMSKSLGNVIAPQEIIQKYGADILRLWVANSDYQEDVRLSQDIIKHVVDIYRLFRNTFRFLLQNTADFKWKEHHVPIDKLEEVDRWILVHFQETTDRVDKAYKSYVFHVVLSELTRLASVTLSGFYLDAIKDVLYCEKTNSPKRRSAQTALAHLTRGLAVLLAPFLSFTSEEAYVEFRRTSDPGLPESVFLDDLASLTKILIDGKLNDKWNRILEIRGIVNDELDKQRKAGVLKSSQEAAVHVNPSKLSDPQKQVLVATHDWPFLLQMAEVHMNGRESNSVAVTITATKHAKCERCWRHRPDVGENKKHPTLCRRCVEVVEDLSSRALHPYS